MNGRCGVVMYEGGAEGRQVLFGRSMITCGAVETSQGSVVLSGVA